MIEWFIIKLLHILAAIFWMGGAIFVAAFLLPAVKKSGPSSRDFMNILIQVYKLPLALNISSALTVICGLILYWRVTDGFQIFSFYFPGGIGLFHGVIFGIVAFIWGHAFQSPNSKKLSKLLVQIQGPPNPEQLYQISKIQKRIYIGGWVGIILMFLSLAGMVSVHF